MRPAEFVTRQRERIDGVLASLLPPGRRVAAINFPNHHNVGDPAVWLGGLRAFERTGVDVGYVCEWRTYDRGALARFLEGGGATIVIAGGGNLGDQYPAQNAREAVLRDFHSVPVVQLPQSIWYEDPARLREFGRLCARHGNVTLLLRELRSLELARSAIDAPAILCPDLAFGIGPVDRPAPASREISWLRREDRESAGGPLPEAQDGWDWLGADPKEPLGRFTRRWFAQRDRLFPWLEDRQAWRTLGMLYERLATDRLTFGLRKLAEGRVVVSDRLHGHLLALLMGIPSVAVDNGNGKVRAVFETFTHGCADAYFAPDHRQGFAIAESLAASEEPR